jgi:SP family sugar:H+ symporter-like MFS transporter
LNIINFFSTFITIATVERFGRVMILFTGAILMFISLVSNAVLASIEDGGNGVGIGVIIFCALYVIGFAYSWGPVVWVVCAEMFPMRQRGKATSLTTFTNWFWTTVVGALFPIASSASLPGCFGFFGSVVFVAIFFVYLLVPETANRTATEIDEEYETHKAEFPRKKWI